MAKNKDNNQNNQQQQGKQKNKGGNQQQEGLSLNVGGLSPDKASAKKAGGFAIILGCVAAGCAVAATIFGALEGKAKKKQGELKKPVTTDAEFKRKQHNPDAVRTSDNTGTVKVTNDFVEGKGEGRDPKEPESSNTKADDKSGQDDAAENAGSKSDDDNKESGADKLHPQTK